MWFWIILGVVLASAIAFLRSPAGKGWTGERAVRRKIGKTVEGERYVFNNYKFRTEDSTVQIDHIVVNRNGVFVIETKNYSGRIYGKDNQQEWTQVLAYGKVKNKLYNPVKQNASHIYHLNEFFPHHVGMQSVIIFVQSNTQYIESSYVVSLSKLKSYLKSDHGTPLAEQEIAEIVEALRENENKDITMREHVGNINVMKQKIENNVCPRCNAPLVLRHGKSGEFYGCSNYPKCKFTKNI